MPRHPRLFLPGATYHVYYRVARGEFVFDDDFDAIEFIEVLRKVRDLDGYRSPAQTRSADRLPADHVER